MSREFEHLFTPFNIGKLTVKNRFAVSAMYLYEAGARGEFTNSAINYYVERAKGGFGLISTGTMLCDTEIDPYNIISDFSPNANPYTWICSARAMTDRVHAYDCKMLAQIAMGNGRNGVGLKSVSEVASFWDPSVKTGAYTRDEIKRKIDQFIKAAVNAKKGGFDGIEVHAMHWGYLLDQFAMSMPIYQNMTLAKLRELFAGRLLNRKTELEYAAKSKTELSIKLSSVADPVETLSGGNQQKVVLAKWMLDGLKVLILDEPTKGIDIGAKEDVFNAVDSLAEKGIGIIFISSDLDEVFRVSDKLLIMDGGRVIEEMKNENVTEAEVLDIVLRSREAQKGAGK